MFGHWSMISVLQQLCFVVLYSNRPIYEREFVRARALSIHFAVASLWLSISISIEFHELYWSTNTNTNEWMVVWYTSESARLSLVGTVDQSMTSSFGVLFSLFSSLRFVLRSFCLVYCWTWTLAAARLCLQFSLSFDHKPDLAEHAIGVLIRSKCLNVIIISTSERSGKTNLRWCYLSFAVIPSILILILIVSPASKRRIRRLHQQCFLDLSISTAKEKFLSLSRGHQRCWPSEQMSALIKRHRFLLMTTRHFLDELTSNFIFRLFSPIR